MGFLAAAVLGIAVAFPGARGAQNYPASVKELVANDAQADQDVDMAGFKSRLRRQDPGSSSTCANRTSCAAGYVPRAVNVPRGLLEFTIWENVGFPDKLGHEPEDLPLLQDRRSLHARGQERCRTSDSRTSPPW